MTNAGATVSDLTGRSLLTLADLSHEEFAGVVQLARRVKSQARNGERLQRFRGYSVALLFEKRSTRTRAAFETAIGEEGGHTAFFTRDDIHLGTKETIEDTARVFGRMFDAIQFRGYRHATAVTLARWAGVPVINGLTDAFHPTQALADMLTLLEHRGDLAGARVEYYGDARNNVAHSLILAARLAGLHLVLHCPPELRPDPTVITTAEGLAGPTWRLEVSEDTRPAPDTDAIYTDVWVSMGEEAAQAERRALLERYRVSRRTLEAAPNAVFLHCLPAVRGDEVSAEVIDGPRSRVFDQAENRKHTTKAIVLASLGLERYYA